MPLIALTLIAVFSAPAWAQPVARSTASRVYDELLRIELDKIDPEAREEAVDYGGWLNLAFFNFDSAGARTVRSLRQYQMRGWASLNLKGVHKAYFRGLLGMDDWSGGINDEYDTAVDRAWYQFDLERLLQNRSGERPPYGLKVKVGRDFATIGTALVLSTDLDQARLDLTAGSWELMTFLGHTLRDSWNIDNSPVVDTRQERWLWGAEVAYTGFTRHRPFVYFLNNNDNTDPSAGPPGQSYEYNSRYLGAGSTGTVLLPSLRYQVEGVAEWGKTYSWGRTSGMDRIQAWACDATLEYLFDVATKPRVGFEYLYATGDSDRTGAPVATLGGNRAGTVDKGFGAFGFRDTGIALSPEISNLHMYAINASFFPLEKIELFKKMEFGSKVFFYNRAHGSAPISDTTTNSEANWVGFEMDFFCNWRLTSDLAWTIRYGAFYPGSAYDGGDKSGRQFLYTGLVFSF